MPSAIKNRTVLEQRRSELVKVATDLFVTRGYSEVSVNEIAEAAQISIGSLYKYIRTKEDLLWLVMDAIYGRLEQLLSKKRAEAANAQDSLQTTLEQYLIAVDAVRSGILLMYREYPRLPSDGQREFMEREQRVVELFADIIRQGNAEGVFHCDDPEAAALACLMFGHTWSLKRWLLHGVSLAQFIEQQVGMALRLTGATCIPEDEDAEAVAVEPDIGS